MSHPTHRRRILQVAAGLLLTLGVTGAAILVPGGFAQTVVSETAIVVATPTATAGPVVAPGTGGRQLASISTGPRHELDRIDGRALSRTRPVLVADRFYDLPPAAPVVAEIPPPDSPEAAVPEATPAPTIASVATPRFRMSALGIDRSVADFPCDRSAPPDDYVYRWGCAGANNLYLLGHAASVFKPLHDAYVAGRLKAGMEASWVDVSGRLQTYHVTTWRLVRPDDASWAIAAQPVPSMTLQTCIGADSEYRLLIRLVA